MSFFSFLFFLVFSLYLFFAVLRSYLVPNKPQVYYYNYTLFPKYYRTLAVKTKNAHAKQALSPNWDSAARSKLHPFMHKIKKESSAALFKHVKAILKFLLPKHQAPKARLYLALRQKSALRRFGHAVQWKVMTVGFLYNGVLSFYICISSAVTCLSVYTGYYLKI